ncbi:MAG: acyl-CoA dehydrogenase family protein, partial [Venatoribacter sp.]
MNFALQADECLPVSMEEKAKRPWLFLERYPELAFYLRGKPFLAKRVEAHYEKVLEFCHLHVAPQALEIERKQFQDPSYVPWELLKTACDYKLFSMMFPSVLGGQGEHIINAFITYELVASQCVAVANLLGVSGLAIGCVMSTFDPRSIGYIAKLISDNEKQRIPTFISTCVTEPGAGSDAEDADEFEQAKLYMTATKVKGGYLLNGNKVFISNGCLAQLHVVTAYNADGKHRPDDLMLFLVKAGSEGLSIPRNEKKMGQRACPASEVVFNNVFVPDDMVCRTGNTGESFAYAGIANVLGLTRVGVGGFATGVAENAYQTALEYCRTHQFLGQPLHQQQWVQIELAHLARRAQVSRSTYLGALLAVC